MKDKMKNILIGLFVFSSILIAIVIILFIKPTIGDGKKKITAYFANIAGINVGTRVTLAGKPVGEICAITAIPNPREGKIDPLGRIYFYKLTLKVDSSVKIYDSDEIALQTTGLMGEKAVAIVPKKIPEKEAKLLENEPIYASSVDSLQNTLLKLSETADSIKIAVKWFEKNQDHLDLSVSAFQKSFEAAQKALENINNENVIASLREAIDSFNTNMELTRAALVEIHDKEMLSKLNVSLNNLSSVSQTLNSEGKEILTNLSLVCKDLASSQGTVGKLIKNDDLYLRFAAVMGKVDTLANDINQYGILFQYNKQWQRIRTKRANLLTKLETPKELRSYCEEELDHITTSLGRLSSIMEKASIKEDPQFKKEMNDLFARVEELLDSLKLYGQDVSKAP